MTHPQPGRRSIRLAGYDYSSSGVYFVTICAFRRMMSFGKIHNAKMIPNAIGTLVEASWFELPIRLPTVELDAFAIMPNHVHGIIVLHNETRAETSSAPTNSNRTPALAHVVQTFKSLAYAGVRRQLRRTGPLWQRDYYEHIVRTGNALTAIQGYIWENPLRWQFDRENPQSKLAQDSPVEPWQI
jgi:REP element-mobilizing transposase RayT